VLSDGVPVKACITPVREGIDVRSLEGLPGLLSDDSPVPGGHKVPCVDTEVLIVGGGPAGLSAALELGAKGVNVLICDDKSELGGKLSLQTHNFFGSVRDCLAGTRGMDIGTDLARSIDRHDTVEVWLGSPVVGAFADGLIGVVRNGRYVLVRPDRLLVTSGAREKALVFPGCDLPGVYGAGAFQTLVNRDLVRASERLFIVGGGNVGLIAAYHALQAGIDVLGIVEVLPECGGYRVHLDKVRRLGIPVRTSHTVLRAEGIEHLERIVISEVDEAFRPIPGTEASVEVDTLLIAVGLSPVSELATEAGSNGFEVYSAGDAAEIAEASAAMFSGRITGREILSDMGFDAEVPPEWNEMLAVLRSKPGPIMEGSTVPEGLDVFPVIRCVQEIPCDPCTEACVLGSIGITDRTMKGRPSFEGDCLGCMNCVAVCPGLAISLVDRRYDPSGVTALAVIPWELPDGTVRPGEEVTTVDMDGAVLGQGNILAIKAPPGMDRRWMISIEVPSEDAHLVAGIRIFEPEMPLSAPGGGSEEEDPIVCRCERVTRSEILEYIERTGTRDFNALKAAVRTGMGPCGGKTCHDLVMRVFREAGVDPVEVEAQVERPFTQEVPMRAFLGGECDE
jgi:NADPH-dependent 2,4-dienoyl-CoA reductase/sulfur reductase-like enzyme/ferredoxin